MYSLVSAYGLATAVGSEWGPATPADLPMTSLFLQYRHLYLTLSSTYLADPINVDFEVFRSEFGNRSETLAEILELIPNATLDPIDEIPQYAIRRVDYIDAFIGDYKIAITAPGAAPSSVVFSSDRTEIVMSHPRVSMQGFYENCLVTVNGYLYKTATDGERVYVPNAARSLFKSRQNQIGVINFQNVGKVSYVPITEDMIYKQSEQSFHSRRAFIDIGQSTVGKTVLAVIGGYLYIPGPAFQQHSDQLFNLNFNHVPLLERYFESAPYLDLSSLGLGAIPKNFTQINVEQFLSDPVFVKYLTHYQSFFIVVDTDNLFFHRHHIQSSPFPGKYMAFREPKFPLVTANGRMPEYLKMQQAGQWAVEFWDSNLHNRVARATSATELVSLTDASQPWKTYYDSHGYFLEIGTHKRTN